MRWSEKSKRILLVTFYFMTRSEKLVFYVSQSDMYFYISNALLRVLTILSNFNFMRWLEKNFLDLNATLIYTLLNEAVRKKFSGPDFGPGKIHQKLIKNNPLSYGPLRHLFHDKH